MGATLDMAKEANRHHDQDLVAESVVMHYVYKGNVGIDYGNLTEASQ